MGRPYGPRRGSQRPRLCLQHRRSRRWWARSQEPPGGVHLPPGCRRPAACPDFLGQPLDTDVRIACLDRTYELGQGMQLPGGLTALGLLMRPDRGGGHLTGLARLRLGWGTVGRRGYHRDRATCLRPRRRRVRGQVRRVGFGRGTARLLGCPGGMGLQRLSDLFRGNVRPAVLSKMAGDRRVLDAAHSSLELAGGVRETPLCTHLPVTAGSYGRGAPRRWTGAGNPLRRLESVEPGVGSAVNAVVILPVVPEVGRVSALRICVPVGHGAPHDQGALRCGLDSMPP